MKTKSITTIMITLFLGSLLTITLGLTPVTAKANKYVQEDWFSLSFLMLGPMASESLEGNYGEPVCIEFSVTNTWTNHESLEGDVYQTSQLNGIAEIFGYGPDVTAYTTDDELLDTRDFFCHERGIDKGIHSGEWDSVVPTWYNMFIMNPSTEPPEAFANLDFFNLQWKIQGVYHYKLTIIDGLCIQCTAGVSHEWVHP